MAGIIKRQVGFLRGVAKAAARQATRLLRRLLQTGRESAPPLLIVASNPASPKVGRIRDRLRFFSPGVAGDRDIRVVATASLGEIASARAALEVDQGLVPSGYYKVFDHVFNVDFERNALDAWDLCGLSQLLAGLPTAARRSEARARFRAAVDGLQTRGLRKAYLFGTGPSLEKANTQSFSDGYVIVCNTIVRDAVLWHYLKPDLIAAGDAIYHFGHSSFARAFRTDLKQRLLESAGKTYFVYPELFDAIVQRELGELESVLIPVPFGRHDDVAVDLTARFELPMLSNVLNILLLPLASTLSRSVWLWGFDGRAPDDKLFWSNSSPHAYPELIPHLP